MNGRQPRRCRYDLPTVPWTDEGAIVGTATCLTLGATLAFGNPQLMEQNKPGYPIPGTSATDEYGKKAEQKATIEVNKEYMGGSGQAHRACPVPNDVEIIFSGHGHTERGTALPKSATRTTGGRT